MQETLEDFFRALRAADIPVSPAEAIDAHRAVDTVGLGGVITHVTWSSRLRRQEKGSARIKTRAHLRKHIRRHRIDGLCAVDGDETIGEFSGKRQEAGAHGDLQAFAEILEPFLDRVARQGAAEPFAGVHIDQDGDIGLDADHQAVQLVQLLNHKVHQLVYLLFLLVYQEH